MFDVTFLGTSGSTPTRERSLPSVAVERDGRIYLFDCGEGTQRQFLKYSLNISRVECVFISHIHGDHIIGLAGLMRTLSSNNRTRKLRVFVPEGFEDQARALMTFDRAFIKYPVEITGIRKGEILRDRDITVTAFRLDHSVKTYGFAFKEDDRLRFDKELCRKLGIKGEMFARLEEGKQVTVKGRRITRKSVTSLKRGKKLSYITDTRPCPEIVKASANSDIMIHEATYASDMKGYAVERKHSTSIEAATMAKRSRSRQLILFHISARYRDAAALLGEARKVFPNTELAYDGMKIKV